MADSTLNRFVGRGTTTQRLAFTPTPPTPASGPDPGYLWWDVTLQAEYAYDFASSSWKATAGGASGLTLLEQHTASSSASLAFTTCISSTYDDYIIRLINVIPVTTATDLVLQMSTNGGSSYDTGSNYVYGVSYVPNSGGSGILQGSPSTGIVLFTALSSSLEGVNGRVDFFNPANASQSKALTWQVSAHQASALYSGVGAGLYSPSTAVNAFRLLFSSGNIASGTIRVYGLAK